MKYEIRTNDGETYRNDEIVASRLAPFAGPCRVWRVGDGRFFDSTFQVDGVPGRSAHQAIARVQRWLHGDTLPIRRRFESSGAFFVYGGRNPLSVEALIRPRTRI